MHQSTSRKHSRRNTGRIACAIGAAALLVGATSTIVDAQTSTWTFAGNGSWNTASNWSPSGVPNSATADAVIDNNGALNVVVTLNSLATVNSVRVDAGDQLTLASRLAVGGATLNGNVTLNSRAEFGLAGAIANAGSIVLNSGNASGDTYVDVLPAGATLSGGGTVTMANGTSISGLTAGGTLTIANQTIQGRGSFGRSAIGIVNQSGGLIRANASGQTLFVDPSTIGLTNLGTMSAVSGGALQLNGNADGTFVNTGGIIRAEAGSEVQLVNATVTGGTLESVGTGVVRTGFTSDSFVSDITINGQVILGARGDLGISGTIINTGNILFTPGTATADTYLDVRPAGATLTGGGTVTMAADSSTWGTTAGGTLTIANQTLEGRGSLGRNSIAIVNQPGNTVRSNVAGGTMAIDPSAAGFTNQGTIEAVNGAVITLTGNGGGTFNNAGGIIRAQAGSEVQFTTDATIVGGLLEATGSGLFRTSGIAAAVFDSLSIIGSVTTNSRGNITLRNTINNLGTIQINPGNASGDTALSVDATNATLTGGGAIVMNGNTSTRISGAANATLTLNNQTIRGGGQVGSGQIVINNQANGIISADTAGRILLVDVASIANAFSNTGLLQATNGGTLRLNDGFTNQGTIKAGASSLVDSQAVLTNGVNGRITGSGELEVNTQLTNNGRIAPGDVAGTLTVDLGNTGNLQFGATSVVEIELAGTASFDRLAINGRTTLGGQLSVRMIQGFEPDPGDSFTVLTSTNQLPNVPPLGAFANAANGATILSADGKAFFTVNYTGNKDVSLSNFDLVGDFDNDGDLDATDIDALLRATPGTVPPSLSKSPTRSKFESDTSLLPV